MKIAGNYKIHKSYNIDMTIFKKLRKINIKLMLKSIFTYGHALKKIRSNKSKSK